MGITKCGIRLDSGDLTYLSQKAREMLDAAGFSECKIVASNALDEYIIRDLVRQGARIDSFGVGERLITARSEPVFGGVYKLAAIEDDEGRIIPKIKISENSAKITTPHFKKIYRIFSKDTGKAEADLICLHDEEFDFSQPLELFDPDATWKRKVYTDIEARGSSGADGAYLPGGRAGVSGARSPDQPCLLPAAGGRPLGRGETLRESPQLLCGPVPEAVGYQAVFAEQPRGEIKLFSCISRRNCVIINLYPGRNERLPWVSPKKEPRRGVTLRGFAVVTAPCCGHQTICKCSMR